MSKVNYIYLTSREYSSGVYQTQIIDWLNLYLEHNVVYELWQAYNPIMIFNRSFNQNKKRQLTRIKTAYKGEVKSVFLVPYRRLKFINNYLLLHYINKYCKDCDRIVIFSRDNLGQEVEFLKKKLGSRIVYYLDLRSALTEELNLTINKQGLHEWKYYISLAYTAFCEFKKQINADKIFCVSNTLKEYFERKYDSDSTKFVLYPCLSSSKKFYYDSKIREIVRKELGVKETDNLYIYSGGLKFTWHIPDTFLRLFLEIAKKDENARLLVMSPSLPDDIKKHISEDVIMSKRIILKEAVPNEEVMKYLNAADFGFLLRENNPVNNVASPSKYAEYILCGLPTIISEGIFDYARFCKENDCGYVLPDSLLNNMSDIIPLKKESFSRRHIAQIGLDKLSKESAVERILSEMILI